MRKRVIITADVVFKAGTRAQYDALETYDSNTLYWITDTQEVFKGGTLFGVGAEATSTAAGLLSAEDKAALDELVATSLRDYYIYNQPVAAATWTINHPLNKRPAVTVVDSAGTVVVGDIVYNSDSQLEISFSGAFSGKAYLN